MPLPFAALAPLIGSGINAISNVLTNSAQKNTNLEIYNRQRADALSDYNIQNQYNSPKEQMARFKEAGLNPHLIYGQTNTAAPIRSNTLDTPKYVAPRIDENTLNAPMIALQMGMLNAQTAKIQAETELSKTQGSLAKETFDYKVGQESWKTNLLQNQNLLAQANTNKINTLLKPQLNQILANTSLTRDKQAQLAQIVTNLKTTNDLLGQRVKSAQYEAEVQNKIKSFGVVGSTLTQLLRFIFK
ncbi:MAG: DNA pilot protein [Microvirus sp.]|nr:MAG: DNA pilot protein [Microvirus sp.]